jgi:ACS family hexuronate transporter-like MFS transporter
MGTVPHTAELPRMTAPPKPSAWTWAVCGLLLLATTINYLDRQTLANLSVRVTTALSLSEEQYGDLEFAFGWSFAAGSLLFGVLADRFNVRWLYPAVLVGWSAAGIATGFARGYWDLLLCRSVLGLFEAGHWPCALTTVQRLLAKPQRHLGNSVLQSGAAIGAILTPPIVLGIVRWADPQEPFRLALQAGAGGWTALPNPTPPVWNLPFIVVGLGGLAWVLLWLVFVRSVDLAKRPEDEPQSGSPVSAWSLLWDRRIVALFVMVCALNSTWQLIRAWLPKFLQTGRGYAEAEALWFNSAFYIAADVGCLGSGAIAVWLARRGLSVHAARLGVYGTCATLTALTTVVAVLPAGWLLMGVLLVLAAGALGLFPCYYSFVQELPAAHLGTLSGFLAAAGWFVSSPFQKLFGLVVDATGSYDLVFALTGLPPLLGLLAMLFLWRERHGSV